MSLPTNRESLKQWCLRKLGSPLIKINISEDQLQDRIDEALSYFEEFHYDGTEKIYISHEITATVITFASVVSGGIFAGGETVTGADSSATATVIDQASDNLSIRVKVTSGTFEDGEVVSNGTGVSGTIDTDGVVLGDIDNKYIVMDDSITNVVKILSTSGLSTTSMFDLRYQMALTAIQDMTQFSMIQYEMIRQHYELINQILVGIKGLRFNRNTGKLYIEMNWDLTQVDQWVVIEALTVVEPAVHEKVYSNLWLRTLIEALFTIQWGQNLSKFSDLALVGGVKLNVGQIIDRGQRMFEDAMKKLRTEYEEPPIFTMA